MEDTKMITENAEKIHQINGIKIGYTDKKITSYGGFSLVAQFFKKIGAWETPRVIPKKPISIDRYSSSWSFIKKSSRGS